MIAGVAAYNEATVPPSLVIRYDARGTVPQQHKWVPVIFDLATAETVARDQHDRVAAYEISNEPNLAAYGNLTPEAFADFYKQARIIIRKYDTVHPVISGGIADVDNWQTYIKNFLALATPDILGLHPYNFVSSYDIAVKIAKIPVAVTEYGVGREGLTEVERGTIMGSLTKSFVRRSPPFLIAYSWDDPAFQLYGLPAGDAFLDALAKGRVTTATTKIRCKRNNFKKRYHVAWVEGR